MCMLQQNFAQYNRGCQIWCIRRDLAFSEWQNIPFSRMTIQNFENQIILHFIAVMRDRWVQHEARERTFMGWLRQLSPGII